MRQSAILFLTLALGCTDYDLKALSGDGYSGDDTATPLMDDAPEATPEPDEEEEECVEGSTAFDIEEVSALQDAFGLPHVRDGLTLKVDGANIEWGSSWRPMAVKVLVMYPQWYFDFYDDSNSLTVNFYPSATPSGVTPATKTVLIRKADLDWEPLLLPPDADWSGDDRNQVAAWLEFDLSDVAPESGYTSTDYFVSLGWDSMGFPNVGYSNFELNCAQNWTDYSSGSYVQNSGQDCSWPMMKIEIETIASDECE
jgi:hypothetical protein